MSVARLVKPDAIVWMGTRVCPENSKGSACWEHPLVHQCTWPTNCRRSQTSRRRCSRGSPRVQDTQACWLLLMMCASTRANFWLRMVMPEQTLQFAERHDAAVWQCLRAIFGTPGAPEAAKITANFPLSMGGLGLTSAVRTRVAAYGSSWADCIKMIRDRPPEVADTIIEGINRHPAPCFQAVRSCERALGDAGLETPSWRETSESPPERESQPEPNGPKFGWQHTANRSLEEQFHTEHWEQLPPPDRALIGSSHGLANLQSDVD